MALGVLGGERQGRLSSGYTATALHHLELAAFVQPLWKVIEAPKQPLSPRPSQYIQSCAHFQIRWRWEHMLAR